MIRLGALAVLVIGGAVIWRALQPASLEEREAAFREAWRRSEVSALEPFFRAETWGRNQKALARSFEVRGWTGHYPPLGEPSFRAERENYYQVQHPVEDGLLTTHWMFLGEQWTIKAIKPPSLSGEDTALAPREMEEVPERRPDPVDRQDPDFRATLEQGAAMFEQFEKVREYQRRKEEQRGFERTVLDFDWSGTELPPVAPATPFAFAWPVPATATVTAERTKNGNNTLARYQVHLEEVPGEEDLRLRYRDFEMLDLGLLGEIDPGAARIALRLSQVLPTLRISREGDFQAVEGMDVAMEELLAFLREARDEVTKEGDAAVLDEVIGSMQTPGFRQLTERAVATNWGCLGAQLAGLELAPGEVLEFQEELPVGSGDGPVLVDHRVTHGGSASAAPGAVRITVESRADGAAVMALVGTALLEVFPGTATAEEVSRDLEHATFTRKVVTILDPGRLLPYRVIQETRVRLQE